MPETTTPAGAMPAAEGATPSQTQPAGAPPAPPATGPVDDGALGDTGKRALEAERAARRDAEARAKAAADELEKLKTAALSEDEKRQKRLADLEREQTDWQRERQDLRLERIVERTAAKLGFTDPADALGLLDRAGIEYEADGTPKNLDKLLETLIAAKPYLGTDRPPVGTADGGSRKTTAVTKEQVELWTKDPAAYDAHRDEILAWMSGHH